MRVLLGIATIALAGCAGTVAPTAGAPGFSSAGPPSAIAETPATVDVSTYRGDMGRTGLMPGDAPAVPVTKRWAFHASAAVGTSAAVLNDLVYVVDSGGTITCLELAGGAVRWTAKDGALSSPTVAGGVVYVGTSTAVLALDTMTGNERWQAPANGPVDGAPGIAGNLVIFATETGTIDAVDSGSGELAWSVQIGGAITHTIAIHDGTVFTGARDGDVIAIGASDGASRWRISTGDPGDIGTAVAVDGHVFVATGLDATTPTTHELVALDPATGAVQWRYASAVDGATVYSPAISGGLAVVVSDRTVTALDIATGQQRWAFETPGVNEALASIAAQTVVVPDNGGNLFGIDLATGGKLWQAPIRGIPYSPTIAGGVVLVGTNLGVVTAFAGRP